jgi:hypothetical protein
MPRIGDGRRNRKRQLRPFDFQQPDAAVHVVLHGFGEIGKLRPELVGDFNNPRHQYIPSME